MVRDEVRVSVEVSSVRVTVTVTVRVIEVRVLVRDEVRVRFEVSSVKKRVTVTVTVTVSFTSAPSHQQRGCGGCWPQTRPLALVLAASHAVGT